VIPTGGSIGEHTLNLQSTAAIPQAELVPPGEAASEASIGRGLSRPRSRCHA
jgi:hypothetical protein